MGIRHKIIGFKLILVSFFLPVFLMFFVMAPALAGTPEEDYQTMSGGQPATGLGTAFNEPLKTVAGPGGAGFNTTATFDTIIGQVITMVLGLLGVIFLILAIYGGYNWMLARGNEEMVETAKKTITNAVIGLIVVLAAYAISWFVINAIGGATLK